jgi:hypothetical protein
LSGLKRRREKGNDGFARVFVPDIMTTPRSDDTATIDATRSDDTTTTTAFETALAAIEAVHARELAGLREQIASAEEARTRAQAMMEQFAGAVRDSEEAARVERERAAAEIADLRLDLNMARVAAQMAQEAADALARADTDRKARGRWARLRSAWRGE